MESKHLSLLCRILVNLVVQFRCILNRLMWPPSAGIHRHQISMLVQSQLKL
ncbi:hypothetical protein P3S67_032678 [Capsicum chacoense]